MSTPKNLFENKKYEECLSAVNELLDIHPNSIKLIIFKCLSLYELGLFVQSHESINTLLNMDHNMNEKQIDYINNIKNKSMEKTMTQIVPHRRHIITLDGLEITFPRNMSWVIPGQVAGSSIPKKIGQIKGFEEYGIRTVINMMNENEVDLSMYNDSVISHHIFGIPNKTAPSIEMMDTIINIMEDTVALGNSVLVHCGGGVGRAGTVLACYILKHGFNGTLNRDLLRSPPFNASSCIEEVRKLRPRTIESHEQEKFVSEYSAHLWKLAPINNNIKFPSILYLPFSPNIDPNDNISNKTFSNKEIVVTEKMDGENCCLYNGQVFARTHSHEAVHESFAPIKQMYKQKIIPMQEVFKIPENYMLFGENMTGIHSIEYNKLINYFYLFGVYDTTKHLWLEWGIVEKIANDIDVPTVPVIFSGILKTDREIQTLMNSKINTLSNYSSSAFPEGFVVRYKNKFTNSTFKENIAKYVRKNHKQTDETWRRTWKKTTLLDIENKENETKLNSEGADKITSITKSKRNLPKLLILCGLPGSGKSSFAKTLISNSNTWIIISQDELGKNKCEEEFSKAIKTNKNVILDKCNHTKKDRHKWYQMSMLTDSSKCLVIYFDVNKEICIKRVKGRENHETIPIGRGENIVETFNKTFERPNSSENIGNIKVISTIEQTNKILSFLGSGDLIIEHTLMKFPRTPHLFDAREFNSGCECTVTRDDLLMGSADRKEFLNTSIVLQEKIDGANMGFSLGTDMKIYAQNRSHYVNSSTALQFKKLNEWISNHYNDLFTLLDNGRYVLYGEWCYARHGIYYTSLSDYFVAFDLFDRYNDKFLSTQKFFSKLSQAPSIVHVPLLTINSFSKLEEINKFLTKKSEFTDGNIEGVYIRKEDDNYLIKRCKVIAPTFMESFDKHWTHKEFVRNLVTM